MCYNPSYSNRPSVYSPLRRRLFGGDPYKDSAYSLIRPSPTHLEKEALWGPASLPKWIPLQLSRTESN